MNNLKIISVLIYLFLCSCFSQKNIDENSFLNRLYIQEDSLQFFKFVSKNNIMWVSVSGIGTTEPIEESYPYSLQNQELKVFMTFPDGEKEVRILRWVKEGDYFIEDEFDIPSTFRRTKNVVYGTKKYN